MPNISATTVDYKARNASAAIIRSVSSSLDDMFFLRSYATDAQLGAGASSYIQQAVNEVASAGGGHLVLPPIELYMNSVVTIPSTVTLDGQSNGENGFSGCRMYRDNVTLLPIQFPYGNSGGGLKGITFSENQTNQNHGSQNGSPGSSWSPVIYSNPWIQVTATGCHFEDLVFRGCYNGFRLGDTGVHTTGRHRFHRIGGQFYGVGVEAINCQDTIYITQPHFWPYVWSDNANVANYSQSNSIGIRFYRCDNPNIVGGFIGGLKTALDFETNSEGSTNKLRCVGLDMDFCRTGVYINCNYANLLFQGCTIDSDPVRMPDSVGFRIGSSTLSNTMQWTGGRIGNTGQENVKVDGSNNCFLSSGSFYANWWAGGTGYCFQGQSGNYIKNAGYSFQSASGN